MPILRIHGARVIFLLCCDNQYTESESREIEMSIFKAIFTQEYLSNALWDNSVHTLQYWRKCCGSS